MGKRRTPGRQAGRLASAGVIREAATALFLRSAYQGTSMEEIATLAGVSKQTACTLPGDAEPVLQPAGHGVGFEGVLDAEGR